MSKSGALPGAARVFVLAFPEIVPDQWADHWQAADLLSASTFHQHLDRICQGHQIIPLCEAQEWLDVAGSGSAAVIVLLASTVGVPVAALPVLESFDASAAIMLSADFLDGLSRPAPHRLKSIIAACLHNGPRRMDTPIGPKPVHTPAHARATLEAMLQWMRTKQPETVDGALEHLAKRYGQADLPEYLQPMGWPQVGQLQDRGLEIGVHETPDRLFDSLRRVSQETGCQSIPVSHVGEVNGLSSGDIERAGGYCALVCDARPVRPGEDRYRWPSIPIVAGAPSSASIGIQGGLWRRLTRTLGLSRAAASLS